MVEKYFNELGIPSIEHFENYLPTAFSSELTLLQKVNKLINDMIETNKLTNEMIKYLNDFIKTFDGKLYKTVGDVLNVWLEDGTLADIINNEVFNMKADKVYVDAEFNKIDKRLTDIVVNVKDFGAIGDNVHDDAPSIREAHAYLKSLGGGVLYFPTPKVNYTIASTVSVDGLQVGLIHDTDNITYKGSGASKFIRAKVAMDTMIYLRVSTNFTVFDTIYLHGGGLADYVVQTNDLAYTAYLTVNDSRFYNAKEIAFNLKTFICVMNRSIFANSKVGLQISGVSTNISTSCTLNSCYALNPTEAGFRTFVLMYSSFISCAVDNIPNGIAYDVQGRGLSFSGCGAEQVRQAFRTKSFRGLTINGFYMLGCGSKDPNNPTEYMFEFVTGQNATIAGIQMEQSNAFKYKLGLTGSNYGGENITVLDGSFRRSEIYFVSNFDYATRPIKLLRYDETNKNLTIETNVNDLPKVLKDLSYMTINHIVTINVIDGIQTQLSEPQKLIGLIGSGKVIIQGKTNDKRLVKLHGGSERLIIENCSCSIAFKNITIENRLGSTYSILFKVINSNNVTLDNVEFDGGTGNSGASVDASLNSNVLLTNGSLTEKGNFPQTAMKIYNVDESSHIRHSPLTSFPSYGLWSDGFIVPNKNKVLNTYEKWVYNNTIWFGVGKIESLG